MRRCDIDKSSFHFVKACGVCHPGGGPAEYDRKGNRYDEFASNPENGIIRNADNFLDGDYYQSDWEKRGVLEADCLICHLKGYNWQARALTVRGGFFYEAPMVGAGWIKDLKKSTPSVCSEKPKATFFRTDYTQTKIADPANLSELITKEVADENCWNCHAMADVKKRGRSWKPETDVHRAKGLTCIYCHPAGEDHEIAKGDILVGYVRDDIDDKMNSCLDCHLNGKDSRAPQPDDNTVRGWALAWKIMCGVGDESDIALGIGGVMLQSTEWSGGLRDRVLPMEEQHCEAVETAIQTTIRSLTHNVFKCHGI